MKDAWSEYFRVRPLPKKLYKRLKAYEERTGLSDTQIVHTALAQYLGLSDESGNISTPSPVQTVKATPQTWLTVTGQNAPIAPWLAKLLEPGDLLDAQLEDGSVLLAGKRPRIVREPKPDAAQESHPHREDNDGADSTDRMGG